VKRAETLAVVAATLVAIATALGVALSSGDTGRVWEFASGVLADNCRNSGVNPDGGVQFIAICPQSSLSADGRWRLVQTPPVGPEEDYTVLVEAGDGKPIGVVPDLNDHLPFILHWSPRRDWFFVNHWQGSGLQRPRVFQMAGGRVVEHDAFLKRGEDKAREISPCLPTAKPWLWVTGDGLRWSKDGRRLAWAFNTRPDMCFSEVEHLGSIPPGQRWKPFLMISDVESGAIIEGSVRLLPDAKWSFPVDGPYADF